MEAADNSRASGEQLAIKRGIITSLRSGVAPSRGTALIEVGLSDFWDSLYQDFIELTQGTPRGAIVYVMGEYGRGKTFLCNYSREKAWSLWSKGFATSYVEVRGFETLADYLEIYRQIVRNIQTPNDEQKGLEPILVKFASRFQSRDDLNKEIDRLGLDPDFAQKLRYFYGFWNRDDKAALSVLLRWMAGEPGIKADLLNLIAEKGFAKLDQNDVDAYLTGMKQVVKSLGYEGLFVFIDEAEDRTRGFEETVVREILRNIKKLHNAVNQDDRFAQTIFLLAGTNELWSQQAVLDEAQRQRMQIKRNLPVLHREHLVELGRKVIQVYDTALSTNLGSRIDPVVLERWVDGIIDKFGPVSLITPRDFLSRHPSPERSFMRLLDELRRQPDRSASDIFTL